LKTAPTGYAVGREGRGVPPSRARVRRLDGRLPRGRRALSRARADQARRHRRPAAVRPAGAGRGNGGDLRGLPVARVARDHALAAPELLRLLPGELEPAVAPRAHAPRAAR